MTVIYHFINSEPQQLTAGRGRVGTNLPRNTHIKHKMQIQKLIDYTRKQPVSEESLAIEEILQACKASEHVRETVNAFSSANLENEKKDDSTTTML